MIPLAVSGPTVIGVVVVGALLLLAILLRSEDRAEAEEASELEARKETDRAPHNPAGP